MRTDNDLKNIFKDTDKTISFTAIDENMPLKKKLVRKERRLNLNANIGVSLDEVGLPREQTRRIESEIKQKLKSEIDSYFSTRVRLPKKDLLQNQNKVTISLGGLGLPEEQTKRVESEIMEMLDKEMKKSIGNRSTDFKKRTVSENPIMALQSSSLCVCGSTYIPGQGQNSPWPLNIPDPARIGIAFRNAYGGIEDSANVLVYTDPSISRDESWIGLESSGTDMGKVQPQTQDGRKKFMRGICVRTK